MKVHRLFTITAAVGLLSLLPILSNSAQAAFSSTKIIEDDAFANTAAMNRPAIQQFLEARGSVLAKFSEGGKTAAEIIYNAGVANNINPEVLIATLQKEQGLISTGTSYDTSADPQQKLKNAMGYACPDTGGCDPKYAGFTNQVNGAAFQFRYNFDGSATNKFSNYQVGQTMTFDGTAVAIGNRATASLYRYTPHVSGAQSFYNYFFSYFTLYASHWAGQNGFPTLAPGDSYQFQMSFLNTGNTTWTSDIVKLGTDGPRDRVSRFLRENLTGNGDPTMWSKDNRIGIQEASVAPGSLGHFNFYMSVPKDTPVGTYREYFRPVAEGIQWMDDDQAYWDVNVANHQAQWAGQNFGAKTIEPGESVMLEVKLRNSGQTTWHNSGQTPVELGTDRSQNRTPLFIREDQTDHNPSGWVASNRIAMLENTVTPGNIGTFRFWYTVPAGTKPGTYREYFRPIHETVRWMDDLGIYFDINVTPQRATYVSQSAFPSLHKGESAQFTVKYLNSGTTTWQKNGATPMRLGTTRANDRVPAFIRDDVPGRNPSGWLKENRVTMVEDSVAPGQTGTFTFWYTVPGDKAPGKYREYFGLVQDGSGWLPDNGLYWDVTVL